MMRVVKLPNGNLIVPKRAESDDGAVVGDGFEEITPEHPDYQRWLSFVTERDGEQNNSATP
jgi:hypothetical protein